MAEIKTKTKWYWALKLIPFAMLLFVVLALYVFIVRFNEMPLFFKIIIGLFVLFFGYVAVSLLLRKNFPH